MFLYILCDNIDKDIAHIDNFAKQKIIEQFEYLKREHSDLLKKINIDPDLLTYDKMTIISKIIDSFNVNDIFDTTVCNSLSDYEINILTEYYPIGNYIASLVNILYSENLEDKLSESLQGAIKSHISRSVPVDQPTGSRGIVAITLEAKKGDVEQLLRDKNFEFLLSSYPMIEHKLLYQPYSNSDMDMIYIQEDKNNPNYSIVYVALGEYKSYFQDASRQLLTQKSNVNKIILDAVFSYYQS